MVVGRSECSGPRGYAPEQSGLVAELDRLAVRGIAIGAGHGHDGPLSGTRRDRVVCRERVAAGAGVRREDAAYVRLHRGVSCKRCIVEAKSSGVAVSPALTYFVWTEVAIMRALALAVAARDPLIELRYAGMAIASRMPRMSTTTSSSMSVKPLRFIFFIDLPFKWFCNFTMEVTAHMVRAA